MDENEKQIVLKKMDERIQFVNDIFECTEKSIENAKKLIQNFPKEFVLNLILFASSKKIFGYKLLGDLIYELHITELDIDFDSHINFLSYLYKIGIITDDILQGKFSFYPEDIQEIDQYLEPVKPGTIWHFIQTDDINSFVDYVTLHNINFHKEGFFVNQQPFFIIEFACYSGAMSILKYLFLNEVPMTPITVDFAIEGGSENVLEFLVDQGVSFDSMIMIAARAHQNKIAKWLNENYNDTYFKLPNCLLYYNYDLFLYFIDECGIDINFQDRWKRSSLTIAVMFNDVDLVKFLLIKGAQNNIKFKKSLSKEMQEILK